MWFGCVLEAQAARGPGSVDGRAAASADTSHYSWPFKLLERERRAAASPSFKIVVSLASG